VVFGYFTAKILHIVPLMVITEILHGKLYTEMLASVFIACFSLTLVPIPIIIILFYCQ